jgi:preprotein translocase SecE subunit
VIKANFFKEAWLELKKVQPPTREETIRSSLGVFLMLAIFGVFLGITDQVVGSAVGWLLNVTK